MTADPPTWATEPGVQVDSSVAPLAMALTMPLNCWYRFPSFGVVGQYWPTSDGLQTVWRAVDGMILDPKPPLFTHSVTVDCPMDSGPPAGVPRPADRERAENAGALAVIRPTPHGSIGGPEPHGRLEPTTSSSRIRYGPPVDLGRSLNAQVNALGRVGLARDRRVAIPRSSPRFLPDASARRVQFLDRRHHPPRRHPLGRRGECLGFGDDDAKAETSVAVHVMIMPSGPEAGTAEASVGHGRPCPSPDRALCDLRHVRLCVVPVSAPSWRRLRSPSLMVNTVWPAQRESTQGRPVEPAVLLLLTMAGARSHHARHERRQQDR